MVQGNFKKKDRYDVGHASPGKEVSIPHGEWKNLFEESEEAGTLCEDEDILVGKTPYINEKKESGG